MNVVIIILEEKTFDVFYHLIITGGFDYFARSLAQRKYQLKDEEDFPPLVFQNPGQDGGRICKQQKHSLHHTLMFAQQA